MSGMHDFHEIEQKKSDLTFQVVFTTIIVIMAMHNISVVFSIYDYSEKINNLIYTDPIFVVIIISVIVIKKKIINKKILSITYYLLMFVLLGIIFSFTSDKGIIFVINFMAPITLVVYMNSNLIFLKILGAFFLSFNTVMFFILPRYQADFGIGLYLSNFGSIVITFFVAIKGIQLFKEYEKLLYKEISTIEEQNDILLKYNMELSLIKDELKEKNEKIAKIAYEDQLTGLMSRVAIIELMEEFFENFNITYYIYYLDIDNFKFIVDTFGRVFSDNVLIKIAEIISNQNKYDFLGISRLDGDGFIIFSKNYYSAKEVFDWIENNLTSIRINEIELRIHFSMGVASTEYIDIEPSELISNAENAMLQSKFKGRRSYCEYSTEIQKEINHKIIISNALEKSLELNEMYMKFQPKIYTSNKKIMGFEALIRWNKKDIGVRSPLDFIEIAEQNGFIHLLGEYIIDNSCKFAKKINQNRSKEESLIVSINISGIQLLQENFYEIFMGIVEKYKIPTYYVGIEITETVLMENHNKAIEILKKFRTEGIKIYLDDFGTGYSSLKYLAQLPIDILKIDKMFIDSILKEKKKFQITNMMIELAKLFDLETIAEGVEEYEQYEQLRLMGCDIVQGYYFSMPLLEEEAYVFLENN